MTTVEATVGNGRTLEEFAKLLEARQKYLNETTEDACAAIAIDALKSIRAITKKATKSTVVKEVKVNQISSLYPSFMSEGGGKKFCLRYTGSNERYKGAAKIVQTDRGVNVKKSKVFQFFNATDKGQIEYLIVSPNQSKALKWAKDFKKKWAMVYSGLAKRALTVLMMKTATIKDNSEKTSPDAETVA